MIGTTGGVPVWATLTAGGGITIAEAAGTITITNPGATGTTFGTTVNGPVSPTGGGLTTCSGYDTNISTDGVTANNVKIRLADDIVSVASITASVDFDMPAGVCTIVGSTDTAQSIYLHANGGVTETIDIHSDLGTAVNSVNIHSDVGGLTLASGLASADAINITATAGGLDIDAADQINITGTENAADAIVITSTAGGIDITAAGTAGEDIDISNTASVNLTSSENAPLAIYLHANAGTAETINIHSDQGTGADSIDINSDVGGITLAAAGLASNDAINLVATAGGVDVDAALQINLTSSQAAATAIVIDASNAAGGIDCDYGTGDMTIDGANGDFTLQTGTGAINLGADAAAHTITVGNVTGATQVDINTGTGGFNVATTGAGDVIVGSADTMLLDSAGVLELNSSAGIIGIGSDADAQNINIGTGAAARVITVGNVTGATQIVGNAGTGGIQLTSTGAGDITIDSSDTVLIDSAGVLELNSSAGVINIGNDDIDQAMNIGTVGERVITVGNIVGVTQIVGNAGTGGIQLTSTGAGDITIDSDDTLLLDSDGVLELNSSAGIISIGNDADAFAVNIGTGAAARPVTVGSTNSTSATTVQCGTGNFVVTAGGTFDLNATGNVTIDSTGGTLGLGEGADAQNMNIGTGAAARVITIGNVTGATEVAINTGTAGFNVVTTGAGDITLDSADTVLVDAAGVIELNSSAGAINIGNDADAQAVNVGTGAAARTVTVGSVDTTSATTIQSGTGDVTITSTDDIVHTSSGDVTFNTDITFITATTGVVFQEGPKIISGAGTPHGSITAPKGSLYLRTDGTGAADRAFINTNAGTDWTAISTAA